MSTSAPTSSLDLYSDDALTDPYPLYDELRSLGPVVYLTKLDAYIITTYDACRAALRNWQVYSSAQGVMFNQATNQAVGGRILLCTDGAQHAQLRNVVAAPLTPKALDDVREHILAEAAMVVERVVAKGRFDAVSELATHLPTRIVSSLVGVPADGHQMLAWSTAMLNSSGPDHPRTFDSIPAVIELNRFVAEELLPDRLTEGWAKRIWDAADRGEIPPEAAPGLMIDYLGPALDTTVSQSGNLIWLLATNPDQWRLLRQQPELAANAINEALRIESALNTFTRCTTADHQVGETIIPAGSRVGVSFAMANRDPAMFPEPARFDITRHNADQHLALGHGSHACPGGHLAKLEMRAILDELVRRVTTLEVLGTERRINNTLRSFGRCDVAVTT